MIKLTCIGAGFAGLLLGVIIVDGMDYIGNLFQGDTKVSQPLRSLWRMTPVPHIGEMITEKEFLQRTK